MNKQILANGIEIIWGPEPPFGCGENEIHNCPADILNRLEKLIDIGNAGKEEWPQEIEDILISLVGEELHIKLGTDNIYIERGIICTM